MKAVTLPRTAHNIVQDVTDLLNILPGVPFDQRLMDAPRCHLKHMRLAGEPDARHWKCQHCNHPRSIVWQATV